MNILKRKTIDSVREKSSTSGLAKTLGAMDLVLFGLGAIVGTGVFVLTGLIAANYAGPAVVLAYALAGLSCIFVALAYTELATMLPTSGSVYTYAYVGLGEVFAWLVGGVIVIEYGFACGAVAAGWSAYVVGILAQAGIQLPVYLTKGPIDGGFINLPAMLITIFVGIVVYLGTKDSKRLNNILVYIKMAAILIFIIAAIPHVDPINWEVFMPFDYSHVLRGSSILFFAYTGFGAIASAAEECKNPKRDITYGIIGSLILATLVYATVAALLTLIAPYDQLNNGEALAHALKLNGSNIGSAVVATGAIAGMTTVMMVNLYGISRIFYVISRDGLLPKMFSKLHPKYDSPYVTIILFTFVTCILSSSLSLNLLGQLSSMGALLDYIVITIVVMLFRFMAPNAERPFKCPALFVIAPIALLASGFMLFKQIIGDNGELLQSGMVLISWFGVVLILYFLRKLAIKRASDSQADGQIANIQE